MNHIRAVEGIFRDGMFISQSQYVYCGGSASLNSPQACGKELSRAKLRLFFFC